MVKYDYEFNELPIWSHIPHVAVAVVTGSAEVRVHSGGVVGAKITLDDIVAGAKLRIEILPRTPLHELLLTSLQRAYDAGWFGPAQEPRGGDENDEHRLTAADVL